MIIQIPPLNEIMFTNKPFVRPEKYKSSPFGWQWAYNALQPFQQKKLYKIRKEQRDLNCVQISTNAGSVSLEIREIGSGTLLDTLAPTSTVAIPGKEYNGIPLDTYQWVFKFNDILPSFTGTCFYIIVADGFEYPSEPIWIQNEWPYTVLIGWNHDKNDYDIIFSEDPQFTLRIDGYMSDPKTESLDTQFEDQNNATITLDTFPKRKYTLRLGGYKGLPAYMTDKLARLFGLRYTTVDGMQYSKSAGAQLDWDQNDTATLYFPSIELEETVPEDFYTFSSSQVLDLLPASGYPYAVEILSITTDTGTKYFVNVPNPIIIENSVNAQSYISTWNSLLLGFGMKGEIKELDGRIAYVADISESFTAGVAAMYKFFTESVRLTTINASATRTIDNSGEIVIDWAGFLQLRTAGTGTVTRNFGNGGVGSATVRYFHNDDIEVFKADTPFTTALPLAFSGVMSSALQEFVLDGIHSSTTILNLELLKYCNFNLQVMKCTNSSLVAIVDPFSFSADVNNFYILADIDFSGNNLTVLGVDNFVSSLHNNANYAYNAGALSKTIIMDNQTPPATPTVTTYITDLVSAGWSVNFD